MGKYIVSRSTCSFCAYSELDFKISMKVSFHPENCLSVVKNAKIQVKKMFAQILKLRAKSEQMKSHSTALIFSRFIDSLNVSIFGLQNVNFEGF